MNKTISRYIKQNIKYPLLVEDVPADDLGVIIVIPCYNESKRINKLLKTLKSFDSKLVKFIRV